MEIEINKAYEMDCVEFLRKLPDESVDLVVTDPPYKLTQKYGTSVGCDNSKEFISITNNRLSEIGEAQTQIAKQSVLTESL